MASTVSIFLDEDRVWGAVRSTPTAYLGFALVSAVFFALALVRTRGRALQMEQSVVLGRALIGASLLAALVWTPYMYLLGGYVWEFPGRYLIPVVPAVAAVAVGSFSRFPRAAVGYAAAALVVAALFSGDWAARQDNIEAVLALLR